MACDCEQIAADIEALRQELGRIKTAIALSEARAAQKGFEKAQNDYGPSLAVLAVGVAAAKRGSGSAMARANQAWGLASRANGNIAAAKAAAARAMAAARAAQATATRAVVMARAAQLTANAALVAARGAATAATAQATAAMALARANAAAAAAATARVIAIVAGLAATVAGVVAGLAALRIAGARIDAVERGLNLLGNQVSKIYGYLTPLTGLPQQVNAANQRATNAQSTANTALDTATRALNRPLPKPVTNIYNPVERIIQPVREVLRELRTQVVERVRDVVHTREVVQTREVVREVQTREVVREVQTREVVREVQTREVVHTREVVREVQTNNLQTRVIQEIKEMPINFAPFAQQLAAANSIARQSLDVGQKTQTTVAPLPQAVTEIKQIAQTTATGVTDLTTTVREKFQKLSKRLRLPEILDALTLVVALHNAAMLSRNLLDTLGMIVENALAIIGLKDEEGQPYDISEELGQSASNFMKSILGQQVWNNVVTSWQAANRVYQSASNIAWSVVSLTDSVRTVAEWTGENVAKIGNGLRRNGVVEENAYGPMSEQPARFAATRKRIDRLMEGLDRADSAAGSLAMVTSEVRSAQSELNQLRQERAEAAQNLGALGTELSKLEASIKQSAVLGIDPSDDDLSPED